MARRADNRSRNNDRCRSLIERADRFWFLFRIRNAVVLCAGTPKPLVRPGLRSGMRLGLRVCFPSRGLAIQRRGSDLVAYRRAALAGREIGECQRNSDLSRII